MANRFSRGEAAALFGLLFCGCLAFFLLGVYAGRRSLETPAVAVAKSDSAPVPAVPEQLGFYRDMLSSGQPKAEPSVDSTESIAGSGTSPTGTQAGQTTSDPSVSTPAPTPAPSGAPRRVYWTVQVGALDTAEEAKQVIIRLEARGYSARLVEPREGVKDFYRVWVGEFEDGPAARNFEEKLKADGFHTYPKKVEEPNRSN